MSKNKSFKYDEGFLKLHYLILDLILTAQLTKREIKVILFILKFTDGFNIQPEWIRLNLADFKVIGITSSHIKKVLINLERKNIIQWNRDKKLLKVCKDFIKIEIPKKNPIEFNRLKEFTSQLYYRTWKFKSKHNATELGIKELPLQEILTSHVSKSSTEDSLSHRDEYDHIDKYRSLYKEDKYKGKKNPSFFIPANSSEELAKNLWYLLDRKHPSSFNYYLSIVEKVDSDRLIHLADQIHYNKKIKNKGGAFVNKTQELLKHEVRD